MSPSRIDELRRRVQNDPASIAFAQLAEEYRRSGQTDEAVRICREGLTRHPGYLSARVTLGRALLDLGQLADARSEFEFVVVEAPENLAAVRGLAEIFHRDGATDEALTYYRRALALARHDPEIEEIVQQLSRQVGVAAVGPAADLSFEEAHQELMSAGERVPLATPVTPAPARATATEGATAPFDFDRLVAALGSPAPPPQVEAVVAGRPIPTIDLPEGVDLGPNPFAALEAELRAHDTVSGSASVVWPPATDGPAVEAAVAASAQATSSVEAALAAFDAPDVVAIAPTEPSDGGETPAGVVAPEEDALLLAEVSAVLADDAVAPGGDGLDSPSERALPDRDEAQPWTVSETWLEVVPVPEAAETAAPVTADAPVAEAAGTDKDEPVPQAADDRQANAPVVREDVLGDLESWLSTLHDRSGS